MKLKIPATFTGDIRDADGVLYAQINGIVDIPDNKVNDSMWSYGFERINSGKVAAPSKVE